MNEWMRCYETESFYITKGTVALAGSTIGKFLMNYISEGYYYPKKTQNKRTWYQENKWLILKMNRSKQRILKRGNSNGWETLNGMFNILSHQGNANENNFERFHVTCIKMSKVNKMSGSSCWCGIKKHSPIADRNANL